MTKLQWHKYGEKTYDVGLDRGVLYLSDESGVPWNGLRAVNEAPAGGTVTPLFFEGIKYGEIRIPGDYEATLRALTYPPQFGVFGGIQEVTTGLNAHHQAVTDFFGLSYRTLIGNDVSGPDHGYLIHILYNLTAVQDAMDRATMDATSAPAEFSWKISGVPLRLAGFRPTSHFTVDSTKLHPELVEVIESILYGGDLTEPRIPDILELQTLIDNWDLFTVTDNGDGTWTITGPDELITMLDPTTFQIEGASAVYLDHDTYTITSG